MRPLKTLNRVPVRHDPSLAYAGAGYGLTKRLMNPHDPSSDDGQSKTDI